jgi:hypothetical protein
MPGTIPKEGENGGAELGLRDAHGVEGLNIHDVEAAPPSISTLVRRLLLMIGLTTSG